MPAHFTSLAKLRSLLSSVQGTNLWCGMLNCFVTHPDLLKPKWCEPRTLATLRPTHFLPIILCCFFVALWPFEPLRAQPARPVPAKKTNTIIEKAKVILNGFPIGKNARVFPYITLEDWLDPYVGAKLGHPFFLNSADRMLHHIKFEDVHDYSWKFRYQANALSSKNTRLSFLFKRKTDQDPFYYGIGNATAKSLRVPAKYASIFFGGEVARDISDHLVLRWSPGFWRFRSGFLEGGEFENASAAQYLSSRFTLSDRQSVDYWKATLDKQWSAFVEIALPVHSTVASYVRLNLAGRTQLPLFTGTRLSLASRLEYLISSDDQRMPYFAMPEAGSKSGLRGFSKDRFRNFAVAVHNIEWSFQITSGFDGFLLTDLAQTASAPTELVGKHIHAAVGLGLRLRDINHPFTVGMAIGGEGFKLFSNVAVGRPW